MVRVSGGELQLLGVGQDPTGAANKSGGMCWCPNSDHRYGIWQLRAKFDAGAGYRPVIQLWPQSNNSTTDGAIDFANDSDAARTVLNVAMHPAGGGTAASGSAKGDFTAWHVYRVEWRATFVRMYLDGTIIFDTARIDGSDGDALGLPPPQSQDSPGRANGAASLRDLVWQELRSCFDPEIPVNIVDLGLIYGCDVQSLSSGGHKAVVRFTLTAQGCGMGQFLKRDIEKKIQSVPGIEEIDVELVWDPPWNQSMISVSAKQQLGIE